MSSPLYRPDLADALRNLGLIADQAWIAARTRGPFTTLSGLFRVLAGGTLTAENAEQVPVVKVGTFTRNDGVQMTGLLVSRSGGQEALLAAEHGATDEFTLQVLDSNQKDVFSPALDGLNRPYLPVTFHRTQGAGWVTITGTGPTAEFTTIFYRQHTHLRVQIRYTIAAGHLTVELYDEDNATVLASDLRTTLGPGDIEWTVPISGDHMALRTVSVRAGVTAGGPAAVQVRSAYSRPNP